MKTNNANVYYAQLWGLREKKYKSLLKNDIKTTGWKQLSPKSEFYFFVPRDERLLDKYMKYMKITDIFPVNCVGIVTARDKLTIKWSPEDVWLTIINFSKMEKELARITYKLGKDVRDWKVEFAQKDLNDNSLDKNRIVPILYRPFDIRHTYYTGKSRGFHCMPRQKIMRHMIKENLGLCVGRAGQVVGLEKPWNIVFCSESIEDFNLFYRGGNVNFPLYIYIESDRNDIFNHVESGEKQPNINLRVFQILAELYNKKPTPENIFYYIYAVLYSDIYRTKYAEFLKTDFPRVPFTKDYKLFSEMGALGQRLVDLHLLKSSELDRSIAKFPAEGDNKVEKPTYDSEHTRVYINKHQYFKGVPQDVWEYHIGGYQVCHKWLKDRKGRPLSLEDIKHYCRVVTSIHKTIELQKIIDQCYPEVEKDIIEFQIP